MAVTYDKLLLLLKNKNMSNVDLQKKAGFFVNIMTRIKPNEYISLKSVESICKVLDCDVDDILEFVEEGK